MTQTREEWQNSSVFFLLLKQICCYVLRWVSSLKGWRKYCCVLFLSVVLRFAVLLAGTAVNSYTVTRRYALMHTVTSKLNRNQNLNILILRVTILECLHSVYLENKRRPFCFYFHMLSCNCQAGIYFKYINHDTNREPPYNKIWEQRQSFRISFPKLYIMQTLYLVKTRRIYTKIF